MTGDWGLARRRRNPAERQWPCLRKQTGPLDFGALLRSGFGSDGLGGDFFAGLTNHLDLDLGNDVAIELDGDGEVARALDRGEAACRQLAARARTHIEAGRPRFTASEEEGRRLADAFRTAVQNGDTEALKRLLAEDAVLYSDAGGKRPAALKPIYGAEKILRFFVGIARKNPALPAMAVRHATINGLPGFVMREVDGEVGTMAFDVRDSCIAAFYLVRNPDKLRHVRF